MEKEKEKQSKKVDSVKQTVLISLQPKVVGPLFHIKILITKRDALVGKLMTNGT